MFIQSDPHLHAQEPEGLTELLHHPDKPRAGVPRVAIPVLPSGPRRGGSQPLQEAEWRVADLRSRRFTRKAWFDLMI